MKKLITIKILLALFSFTAQAATISIGNIDNINVADVLLGSSNSIGCTNNCDFVDANGTLLTDVDLATVVTSNAANYTTSSSVGNSASFDLGFNGFNLYNGDGNDLVVFIVGNNRSFGLDVFDTQGFLLSSDTYNVDISNTVFDDVGNWLCVGNDLNPCPNNGFALSAVFIDLGDSVAGDVAIGSLQFNLNDAAFSLAGGFYTEASPVVVPLPMPIVLFSSGLFLLGWVGRKKSI
ncbi:hypothetical protein MNBD_GAMMA05-1817 [hydrothermal vent metagenome]|uniref:Uncharacterized protein n=1 Tax=hydrothermal vent metagenome TaxID=652676 RepID=A0A3B0WFQ9_9ZZZZ